MASTLQKSLTNFKNIKIGALKNRIDIVFISTCLKENLIPGFANIKLPNHMREHKKQHMRKAFLRDEVHNNYARLRQMEKSNDGRREKH